MLLRRLTRASAATLLPVAALKRHLVVDYDDQDVLISTYAEAAIAAVEGMIGQSMVAESWEMAVDVVSGDLALPRHPVTEVTQAAYYDADDVNQVLDLDNFYVFSDQTQARLRPKTGTAWPVMRARDDALRVQFATGMVTVPEALVVAAMMWAGHMFRVREAVAEGAAHVVPFAVEALIEPHKRLWVTA